MFWIVHGEQATIDSLPFTHDHTHTLPMCTHAEFYCVHVDLAKSITIHFDRST